MSGLVFLLSAEIDIQSAHDFYEGCQEDRGAIFMHYLDGALGQLRTFPKSGPVIHRKYRRLLVPGYPYGIFYTIERRGVMIAGVMDNRQNPKAIYQRLN